MPTTNERTERGALDEALADQHRDAALAKAVGAAWLWDESHVFRRPPAYSSDIAAALSLRHALRERAIAIEFASGPGGTYVGTFTEPASPKTWLPADATDAQIALAIAQCAARALGCSDE